MTLARPLRVAALLSLTVTCVHSTTVGTVFKSGDALVFKPEIDHRGLAWGNFTDQSSTPSGFSRLTIVTNPTADDNDQAKAAGFLEGVLTAERAVEHTMNMRSWLLTALGTSSIPPLYTNWMTAQDTWMRQQVASNKSDFWVQTSYILSQFDGLVEGIHSTTAGKNVSTMDLMIVNAVGDFLDLLSALDPSRFPDYAHMSDHDIRMRVINNSHCSALIKLTGNYSELFFGHSSWFTYSAMIRIFKSYQLNFQHAGTASKSVSFSSYGAMLSSLDDFYEMTGSGLAMVQTSNGIYNKTLYKKVSSSALLAWHRVRLAGQIASTGVEWAETISQYNSGTYTNQYMVLDLKLFSPGKALTEGLLVVAEQIPGEVAWMDATNVLERGYWPSYNVPAIPSIYEKSGYPELLALKNATDNLGELAGLSYQLAPRAKIFRRDQGSVADLASFKAILRQNEYQTDPFFPKPDPFNAICSRGDLASDRDLGGCYDTKVSSYSMFNKHGAASIINGPTTSGGILPPFKWSSTDTAAHAGQPTTFDFAFEDVVEDFVIPESTSDAAASEGRVVSMA